MTSNTPARATRSYDALLSVYKPRPIASQRQYNRVMEQIAELMEVKRPSQAEQDLLELLSTLVARYESLNYPAPDVSPADVLAHLILVRGVSKAELAQATGVARQTITNTLSGARGISGAIRVKFADYFHVSPSPFAGNE